VPDNITPIFLPSRAPEISRELAQDSVGIFGFVIDKRSKLAFNVEHGVPHQPGDVEVRSGIDSPNQERGNRVRSKLMPSRLSESQNG
jgi:hypothetical protein